MSNDDERWNNIEVKMTEAAAGSPRYFFDFDFGVFRITMDHMRLYEPFEGRTDFWNVGLYRNSLPAFQTFCDDSQETVIKYYRQHSRAVDVYRKWFYLKNLVLKSKKD